MTSITDVLIEELNNITKAIERMADNSRYIKGVIALLATISFISGGSILIILSSIICIFVFSWLDAYYLSLERGFRNLYNKVRVDRLNGLNFDNVFEMKPIIKDKPFNLIFTKSILPYYSAILILAVFRIVNNALAILQ